MTVCVCGVCVCVCHSLCVSVCVVCVCVCVWRVCVCVCGVRVCVRACDWTRVLQSVMLLSEFSGVCDDSRFCHCLCIIMFIFDWPTVHPFSLFVFLLLVAYSILFFFSAWAIIYFGGFPCVFVSASRSLEMGRI